MAENDDTLCSIAREDLASVSGGKTLAEWTQMAKAHVGSPDRCEFLKEYLERNGVTGEKLQAFPAKTPGIPFRRSDLINRRQREYGFHCGPRTEPTE